MYTKLPVPASFSSSRSSPYDQHDPDLDGNGNGNVGRYQPQTPTAPTGGSRLPGPSSRGLPGPYSSVYGTNANANATTTTTTMPRPPSSIQMRPTTAGTRARTGTISQPGDGRPRSVFGASVGSSLARPHDYSRKGGIGISGGGITGGITGGRTLQSGTTTTAPASHSHHGRTQSVDLDRLRKRTTTTPAITTATPRKNDPSTRLRMGSVSSGHTTTGTGMMAAKAHSRPPVSTRPLSTISMSSTTSGMSGGSISSRPLSRIAPKGFGRSTTGNPSTGTTTTTTMPPPPRPDGRPRSRIGGPKSLSSRGGMGGASAFSDTATEILSSNSSISSGTPTPTSATHALLTLAQQQPTSAISTVSTSDPNSPLLQLDLLQLDILTRQSQTSVRLRLDGANRRLRREYYETASNYQLMRDKEVSAATAANHVALARWSKSCHVWLSTRPRTGTGSGMMMDPRATAPAPEDLEAVTSTATAFDELVAGLTAALLFVGNIQLDPGSEYRKVCDQFDVWQRDSRRALASLSDLVQKHHQYHGQAQKHHGQSSALLAFQSHLRTLLPVLLVASDGLSETWIHHTTELEILLCRHVGLLHSCRQSLDRAGLARISPNGGNGTNTSSSTGGGIASTITTPATASPTKSSSSPTAGTSSSSSPSSSSLSSFETAVLTTSHTLQLAYNHTRTMLAIECQVRLQTRTLLRTIVPDLILASSSSSSATSADREDGDGDVVVGDVSDHEDGRRGQPFRPQLPSWRC